MNDINSEPNQFSDQELNSAIDKLKKYKTENNGLPKCNDPNFKSIANTAKRGVWKEFQIESCNDLLLSVFGEVNHEISNFCK